MLNQRHPAAILRAAWSTTQLRVIREVLEETLVSLQALDPRDVLGRELTGAEGASDDCPIREALAACCDEMRMECGVAMLRNRETFEGLPAQRTSAWGMSYVNALDRYRDAAGAMLGCALLDHARATGAR